MPSEIQLALTRAATAAFVKNEAANAANVVKLRNRLGPQDFQRVSDAAIAEGFRVEAGSGESPHPKVTAYTDVLEARVRKNIGALNYKEIGPSAAQMYHADPHKPHHFCTIRGDAKQAVRATRLRQMMATRHERDCYRDKALRQWLAGTPNALACHDGAQNCDAPAFALKFTHSIYDFTPEMFAEAMNRAGASCAFAVILAPQAVEMGALHGVEDEVHWRTLEKRNGEYVQVNHGERCEGKAIIDFAFKGAIGYSHSKVNYDVWLTATIIDAGRTHFVIERERFGQCLLLRIDRVSGGIRAPVKMTASAEYVVIPDLETVLAQCGLMVKRGKQGALHILPKSLFETVRRQYSSANAQNRNLPQLKRNASALITSVMVGGASLLGFDREDYNSLNSDACIVSLYFQCDLLERRQAELLRVATRYREEHDEPGKWAWVTTWFEEVFHHVAGVLSGDTAARLARKAEVMPPGERRGDFAKDVVSAWRAGAANWMSDWRTRTEVLRQSHPLLRPSVRELAPGCSVATLKSSTVREVRLTRPMRRTEASERNDVLRDELAPLNQMRKAFEEYQLVRAPAEQADAGEAMAAATTAEEPADIPTTMLNTIIAATKMVADLKWDDEWEPEILEVNGPPGTGKTHYETHEARPGDLIVVGTREAAYDTTARLARMDKTDVKVYTEHAAILNAASHPGGTVFFDEAYLMEEGRGVAAALAKRATRVVIVGDPRQITYKDRTGRPLEYRWEQLVGFVPRHTLNENWRNPENHVRAYNKRWGTTMIPKRLNEGVCHVTACTSASLRLSVGEVILTYSQALKKRLKPRASQIYTVHEAQGTTHRDVHLVVQPRDIARMCEDVSYINVATTRHTNSLRVTMLCDDGEVAHCSSGQLETFRALADLSVDYQGNPVRPPAPKRPEIQALNADGGQEMNVDFEHVELVLRSWLSPDPYGCCSGLHTVTNQNHPEPAVKCRVARSRLPGEGCAPDTLEYARLSDVPFGAEQSGHNANFFVNSLFCRNLGGRTMRTWQESQRLAPKIYARVIEAFFAREPRAATAQQLDQHWLTFWCNVDKRNKAKAYREMDLEYPTTQEVKVFVKEQLKLKFTPSVVAHADITEAYLNGAERLKPQKPGQGVAYLNKMYNAMMYPHIAHAMHELDEATHPWVVIASGMSDADMMRHLRAVMHAHQVVLAVKGDDVLLAYRDPATHEVLFHTLDGRQFDKHVENTLFAVEAEYMRACGTPEKKVHALFDLQRKYNIRTTNGALSAKNVQCGRMSGTPNTLSGNCFASLTGLALACNVQKEAGSVSRITVTRDSLTLAEHYTCMEYKHNVYKRVADFIGFLAYDDGEQVHFVPDVPRMAAKEVSRKYTPRSDWTAVDRALLAERAPTADKRYALRVLEVADSVRDRLSVLESADDDAACVHACLAYHHPDLPSAALQHGAALVIKSLLAFLRGLACDAFVPIFARALADRLRTHHVVYINEDVEPETYEWLTSDDDVAMARGLEIPEEQCQCTTVHPFDDAKVTPGVVNEAYIDDDAHDEAARVQGLLQETGQDNPYTLKLAALKAALTDHLRLPTGEVLRVGKKLASADRPDAPSCGEFQETFSARLAERFARKLRVPLPVMKKLLNNPGLCAWYMLAIHKGQAHVCLQPGEICYGMGHTPGLPVYRYERGKWRVGKFKGASPPDPRDDVPLSEALLDFVENWVDHSSEPTVSRSHHHSVYRRSEPNYARERCEVRDALIEIGDETGCQRLDLWAAAEALGATVFDADAIEWIDAPRSKPLACFYDAAAAALAWWHRDNPRANAADELRRELYRATGDARYVEVARAPAEAPEALAGLGVHVVWAEGQPDGDLLYERGAGPCVFLRVANDHWKWAKWTEHPSPARAALVRAQARWETEGRFTARGRYRGYVPKDGGAAEKICGVIAGVAPVVYGDLQSRVVMFGEAPGSAARYIARCRGVSVVHATSRPESIKFRDDLPPNVITSYEDLLGHTPCGPAALAICDAQGITPELLDSFEAATRECTYHIVKVQDPWSRAAAEAERRRYRFVLPTCKNVRSLESYAVDFAHPTAMTLEKWAARCVEAWSTDADPFPAPHPTNWLNPVKAPEWCEREVHALQVLVREPELVAGDIAGYWQAWMDNGLAERRGVGTQEGDWYLAPGEPPAGPLDVEAPAEPEPVTAPVSDLAARIEAVLAAAESPVVNAEDVGESGESADDAAGDEC
jgi:hypothetical protein